MERSHSTHNLAIFEAVKPQIALSQV